MKYFIVSCLLLASGVFAQDDGNDCQVCEYGIKIFFAHLTSEQGARFQISTLHTDVCPAIGNPLEVIACERWTGENWVGINHVIYNDGAAQFTCNSITGSNCTHPKPPAPSFEPKAWTCDDCMREVALIATQYSLPHVTRHMEHLVAGEAYCANPALGLEPNEIDECREKAYTYMGPAFRGLDAAYVSNAQAICHYWYNGVCHQPQNAKMFPMK